MKKSNIFKLIMGIGAISGSAATISSCGKSITPHQDNPIPANTLTPAREILTPASSIFNNDNIQIPFTNAVKKQLNNQDLSISNITIKNAVYNQADTFVINGSPISYSTADITARLIIKDKTINLTANIRFNANSQKYSFTNINVINGTSWSPTNAKQVFASKDFDSIVLNSIANKMIAKKTDILKITHTVTVVNYVKVSSKSSATVKGSFTLNKVSYKFNEQITYYFNLNTYVVNQQVVTTNGTFINPHLTPTNTAVNPFDDSYTMDKWYNTRNYKNRELFGAINTAANKNIGAMDLYDFAVNEDSSGKPIITWGINTPTNTPAASVEISGHSGSSSSTSPTPFTLTATFNYATNSYLISNFKHQDSYATVLNSDHIKTALVNDLYSELKTNAKLMTNIKFSTPNEMHPHHPGTINEKTMNHPSTIVSGEYNLNANKGIDFSIQVAYNYDSGKYGFSNLKNNTLLNKFDLGKDKNGGFFPPYINPDLHNAINSSLMAQGSADTYDIAWASSLSFPNNDYGSKIVSRTLSGHAGGFDFDTSPVPFTETVTYNATSDKYTTSNLVLLPAYDKELTKDLMTPAVKKSLQDNIKGATTTDIYLTDFTFDKKSISDKVANKPSVEVSGTALMNGLTVKSFTETVTYNYADNNYSVTNFKLVTTFNPLDNTNVAKAMQEYLTWNYFGMGMGKVNGLKITYVGKPDTYASDNSADSWIQLSYFLGTSEVQYRLSGDLSYSFTNKEYTFTADKV